MKPVELLTYLRLQGVQVRIDDGGFLKLKGRKAVIEPVAYLVKQYKPELMKLMVNRDFNVEAVVEALRFICKGLEVSSGYLLIKYFTTEDLLDISRGEYQNFPELRDLILSDPEYPFVESA
ncbi:hypothetical protein [Endozoicomonas arenosclerae]|uniref:hypothetical protein n=1 Tax=Endozoicomonas arenosclerae TaxID=1633495 RepID=UPI0007836599|nr:hypothetical protein [Endozoicomonas arenosclerae]